MTLSLQQTAKTAPLSRPAMGAALIAFTALLVTYGPWGGPDSIVLFVLMGLLVALRLSPRRLPPHSWAHWLLRLALFTPVIFANWDKFNDPQSWLFDTASVGAFGMLAAAEFVVQAARTLALGQSNGGALCLLSGYVFLAACTTDQVWPIRVASPLYFAFAVLSLPRFGANRRQKTGGTTQRVFAVASALALGAVVYALFWAYRIPLMQLGAGTLHDHPPAQQTGLSQQPTLEPTFGMPGSLERVLRVQNDGGQAYLRGIAYDTYAQGRWGPIVDERRLSPFARVSALPAVFSSSLRVTTLTPVRGVLFVPLGATHLFVNAGETLVVQQDTRNGGFQLHMTVPPMYAVGFDASREPPLLRATLAPDERARDLVVPADIDPRVSALAQQVTQNMPTPEAKAAAVQQFFLRHFQYSLTIHPGPGDPVSSFILGRKAAHCEFFASGAVLMLRAAGLPARYVTGYYAHESDGANLTVVRQQDAHAWAEVWLGHGWATLDATPAGGRPPATAEHVPWTHRTLEFLGDCVAALRAWVAQFTTGQIIGALAIIGLLYWGVRTLWRRLRQGQIGASRFAYADNARLEEVAERFESWLRRIGVPCPPNIPWAEHAEQVGLTEAQGFVQSYNAARFGLAGSAGAAQALERELQRLEQAKLAKPSAQDAAA